MLSIINNTLYEKFLYNRIFKKNWKSSHDLISYLEKKKFNKIGQGWYSTVFSLPNSSYVIKINSGDFDYGYAFYIDICLKYYNIHLPKIIKYKPYNFNNNPFYFVLLPKYKKCNNDIDIDDIKNNLYSYCPVLETTIDPSLYVYDICKENLLIDDNNNVILADIILTTRNR